MATFDPISWLFDIGLNAISAYEKLSEENRARVRDLFVSGHIKTGQDVIALVQLGSDLRKERDATAAELAASQAAHAGTQEQVTQHREQLAQQQARITQLEQELAALKSGG